MHCECESFMYNFIEPEPRMATTTLDDSEEKRPSVLRLRSRHRIVAVTVPD